jgi:hypothetical protein
MGIISGEAGGFAVPTNLGVKLFRVDPLQAYIRARALVIPPGDTPDWEVDIPATRQGTNPNCITRGQLGCLAGRRAELGLPGRVK